MTTIINHYNGRYYAHVRVKLPYTILDPDGPRRHVVPLYFPPKGIDVLWYPHREGMDEGEFNCTFMCSMHNPDPLMHRDASDIERELSKITIVKDNLKKSDEPNLHTPLIKHETILNHPGLDYELDFLRSTPKQLREVAMTEGDFKQMNEDLQAKKGVYQRTKLIPKRIEEHEQLEGKSLYIFDFGEVQ